MPPLNTSTIEVRLKSSTNDRQELTMNITQFEDDILYVNWTFADPDYEVFETPKEVASDKTLK